MKHLLLTLFLASSVLAVAQTPAPAPQTRAEKKAARKAEKQAAREAKAAPAPAAKPMAAAKPAPAAKTVAPATAIVANKDSKTYHRADCTFVAKMKEANRVGFASAGEAAKAGYKPCKVCKPQ